MVLDRRLDKRKTEIFEQKIETRKKNEKKLIDNVKESVLFVRHKIRHFRPQRLKNKNGHQD